MSCQIKWSSLSLLFLILLLVAVVGVSLRIGHLEASGLGLAYRGVGRIVVEGDYSPIAASYEKLTGLDTPQTLTVPTAAYRCIFYVEDDDVRWTDDGTNPDPATKVGAMIAAGQYLPYAGDLDAVELKGTANTIVHVFYYGL